MLKILINNLYYILFPRVNFILIFLCMCYKKISLSICSMDLSSYENHGEAGYITNFEEIAYYQNKVLYIIIAKEIQPSVDDMRLRR